MQKQLTSKVIETLRPGERRYELRDTLLPGFGIRVSPNGRRTWFIVGRVRGSQVRHTIATYPTLSLSEARGAARTLLGQMQLGTYEDGQKTEVLTLEKAAEEFISKYARPKNRDWKGTESVLRKFAALNGKPLAEIKRADVVRILDEIVASGAPHSANRALAALKTLFAWALDRGMVEVHPIVRLKPPAKQVARDRILSDAELAAVWRAAEDLSYPYGTGVKLLILTGQRRGEVVGMRWLDIDLERLVWTIPAHVAKNGRTHEVPLSEQVVETLRTIPRFAGSDLVFTTTGRTPISGFSKFKRRLTIAAGAPEWRIHDLRRTAASGMARLGIAPHVIEKVLNHLSGAISGVAAVYNRHAYELEKREALERWALHIASLPEVGAPPRAIRQLPPTSVHGSFLSAEQC